MTTEGTTIAIDFGSTKIVTTYLNKNNRANIITDAQTNRVILSSIQLKENKCIVGNGDDYKSDENVVHTISGVDLKLLLTSNDLDDFSLLKTETMPNPAFLVNDQKQERRFTLMQLIVLLLAKVKENAESFLKTKVQNCYITVPTCYTPQQRLMMQDVGKMVGFKEVQIVNDTTAAALTYVFEKKIKEDPHKILIVDIGATSTEAAIFLVEDSTITVQASKGEMNLGGNNFDMCLLKHFADEFKVKTGVDLTGSYKLSSLRRSCEDLKKRLASSEMAKVTIQSLHNGQPYDLQLTRTEFEELCNDVFTRIMNVVKEVLDQTENSSIEKVFLVGGGSRLPKIQEELVVLMKGKQLSRILNQDEATGTGAAYYTLKKIDIKMLTTQDNDKDSKSGSNFKELRQFLFDVQDNNKAFNEYKAERINLEALCYRFKRELKNRNLDDKESETILSKCNETLVWIKQTDYNNPTTMEMVKEKAIELTKVNTNVASQPEKMEKVVELTKINVSNQPQKSRTVKELIRLYSYDSKQPKKMNASQPEKKEVVKEQAVKTTIASSSDSTEPKIIELSDDKEMETKQSVLQEIFQQGMTFYENEQYSEASNVFTEVLNSKDIKDENLESFREMRAHCYLKMEQFQLCIDDIKLIPRTACLQGIFNEAEQSLYQEKVMKILEESDTILTSEDSLSVVLGLSLITEALENKPKLLVISNINCTSGLLHLKTVYNIALRNYSEAILDINQNMQLFDDIPELTSQKKEMYQLVSKELNILTNEMKKNKVLKQYQGQLSHIEKWLKKGGYSSSSSWFSRLFSK